MSDLNNAFNFQVVFFTYHFLLTHWKNCQDLLIPMSRNEIEIGNECYLSTSYLKPIL